MEHLHIKNLLDTFFRHYLTERDVEATMSLVTDNIITIGTGEHEISKTRAEYQKLLIDEFAELPDPLHYEILDFTETFCGENVCNVLLKLKVWLEINTHITEIHPRATCTCIRENDIWKISIIHMSTPEPTQEKGSFFPLYYGNNVLGTLSPKAEEKLMELISDALPGGIMGVYLEEGFPLYTINKKMLDILGYTYQELLLATGGKMSETIFLPDREAIQKSIFSQLAQKNEYQTEYRAVGKDALPIWVSDIGKKIVTEDGREAILCILTDISERIQWELQLKDDAEHDFLTKLNNRKNAIHLIEKEFSRQDGGNFFICDVDNFKQVNDTKGHNTGDQVLIQLASIIQKLAEKEAITARLGGDEYMLFFYAAVPRKRAIEIIQSIQQEFLDYMTVFAPQLHISVSAGGTKRQQDEDFQKLYARADTALYHAKQNKGQLEFLESD